MYDDNNKTKGPQANCFYRRKSTAIHVTAYKDVNNACSLHFSICARHPCAGAVLIFSASFQVLRMIPEGDPKRVHTLRISEP